jgi:uncharacterized protein YggE
MRLCLCVIAAIVIAIPPTAVQGQDSTSARPLVSTVGEAEVRVVPDLADLAFQVEVRDADLSKARKEQAERAAKVLAALRTAGIAERELQTSQVEIQPNYAERTSGPFGDSSRESATARFFVVSQSIACTLHDVAKISNVTAAAVLAGATRVEGATLRTSELRKYRDQARAAAARAAKEKAIALAGELGSKVGRPFTITEMSSYYGQIMGPAAQRMQQSLNSGSDVAGSIEGGSVFAPGTISIQTRVAVSFVLE